jgi:predicted O-methyltransferase YrrM
LCRLINKYKIKVFLELGTSVGINILRLALLCPEVKFVTIEANPYYIRLAKLLSKITGVSNVEFINNYFSEVLPGVLARYKPEFVYVDGDHSYSSTVQYFNMICSYCGECTRIVVIDDITWSESMRKAWKNLFCRFVDKKISFYKFGLIILKTHL